MGKKFFQLLLLWGRDQGLQVQCTNTVLTLTLRKNLLPFKKDLFMFQGIGFMVFSYNTTVRVMLTAENATMTRPELEYMLASILEEIETLYEISVRAPSIQPYLN